MDLLHWSWRSVFHFTNVSCTHRITLLISHVVVIIYRRLNSGASWGFWLNLTTSLTQAARRRWSRCWGFIWSLWLRILKFKRNLICVYDLLSWRTS